MLPQGRPEHMHIVHAAIFMGDVLVDAHGDPLEESVLDGGDACSIGRA